MVKITKHKKCLKTFIMGFEMPLGIIKDHTNFQCGCSSWDKKIVVKIKTKGDIRKTKRLQAETCLIALFTCSDVLYHISNIAESLSNSLKSVLRRQSTYLMAPMSGYLTSPPQTLPVKSSMSTVQTMAPA